MSQLVFLALVCGLATACGGGSRAKPTASVERSKPPAYRVGQYCVPRTPAPWTSFGLVCAQHHLRRR